MGSEVHGFRGLEFKVQGWQVQGLKRRTLNGEC